MYKIPKRCATKSNKCSSFSHIQNLDNKICCNKLVAIKESIDFNDINTLHTKNNSIISFGENDDSLINSNSTSCCMFDNMKSEQALNYKKKSEIIANFSQQNIIEDILEKTPLSFKLIVKHLLSNENQSIIDGTPHILCVDETDTISRNDEDITLYYKLAEEDLLSDNERQLIENLYSSFKISHDISEYAIIKLITKQNCSFEYLKYLLADPNKQKMFDINTAVINTLQELPEYNTTIYKHEKYRYSVLSLPPITAEIMRKEFTIDSSQSGSKICYIIEKSVDLFDSNSYSLELRSHILIRIIQISQGEYLNECLIKEYSVIHYGNLFSTRSQMMESAAEERTNFYTSLKNYLNVHPMKNKDGESTTYDN